MSRAINECSSVEQLVERWGNSTSIALLDPACKLFKVPGLEGAIGYRNEKKCAVVFGDPVCEFEKIPQLIKAFQNYCETQHWNIAYIATTPRFAKWAINNVCRALIEIGRELFLDPQHDPTKGSKAHQLRKKIRHAKQEGVTVQELLTESSEIERAIENVGEAWLKSRHGLQIFLSHIHLFDNRTGKRWLYAQIGEKVVGVVLLNKLDAYQGWVLNLLMVIPDAPQGTSELLVVSTIESLRKEGCHFLTFGSLPSSEIGEIIGISKSHAWLARTGFKLTKKMFNLDGRTSFWKKFQTEDVPSYVLFDQKAIHLRDILSILRSLNVSI